METAIDHALAVKGRFHVRILFHELFHPRVLHHLLMRAVAGFARGPFDKGEDHGFARFGLGGAKEVRLLALGHVVLPCFDYTSGARSEEHTSELQSLMRISYAVFCLKKKTHT